MKKCKDCDKDAEKRGYCSGHYKVRWAYGFFSEGKRCSRIGCKKLVHGVNGILCRNHLRKEKKEGSNYWKRVKIDLARHKGALERGRQWKLKKKNDPNYQEKNRTRQQFLRYKRQILRQRVWRMLLSDDKKKEYLKKDNYTRQFGNWKFREETILRDGEKCTKCGITREEHKARWNQDLHVDHKDNYGRNVVKQLKNNDSANLETLCIRCHRSKSYKEQKIKRDEEVLIYGKDFTEELKTKIRKKYSYNCANCGMRQTTEKRKLDVHHVNGDKHDNREENLISLCLTCHYKRELLLKRQNK